VIAKVEPLTSARALRGPFDYRLPGHMRAVSVGSVLRVPLGRQRVLGVVVELAESSAVPPERLVEPLEALDRGVPPELVRLGLWVAEDCASTPARGLALVLPPGTGASRPGGPASALHARLLPDGERAVAEGARLGAAQRRVLEALAAGPRPAAQLGHGAHATLRSLQRRRMVAVEDRERPRRPRLVSVGAAHGGPPALTSAQQEAVRAVEAALDGPPGADRRLLLHGVTGSGKTEVYLRAVALALARGRSAIVMVPEIALTPQTAGRFAARFGDEVALMHSRLSAGERHDEWRRMRDGRARVCVGPRSAVFAPVRELGLVVLDEEHDGSYKQEGDPRYDARRVAERRAGEAGAVLLAGTATPRPESRHRLRRIPLPERVDGRRLPPVELVGMAGVSGALHPRTREALERVRRRKEKAIVLVNRRGWANFLSCRTCGHVWGCPECDVSLVLHRAEGLVRCHHCGHSETSVSCCPDCGSASVARHGAGTERLEQELGELVSPLPVFRLDSDVLGRGEGVGEVLSAFERARSGVLVGTQMVAKGHDFPAVTLGVVLDADATLRFPSFRAEERTFAQVAQLAGRAGRGAGGGRVVVQALDPAARALRHAAAHDAEGFLRGELARREALHYPPFAQLLRVVCSSALPGPEVAAATAVRGRLELSPSEGRALGPAPLFRLRGRERAQVVVKAQERGPAVDAVRRAVQAAAADVALRGVAYAVDVDPD
jgi:primosomal protein N' (replication factor Y)